MSRDLLSVSRASSLEKTSGGPGVVYIAPYGTTFPTGIGDIVDLDPGATQFQPVDPWEVLGLTRGGITVQRGFEETQREADQTMGAYGTRPTSWMANISTEILNIDTVTLQRLWVGGAITSAAAVETTVGVAIASGQTALTVMNGTGIVADDLIVLGTGALQELQKVSAITDEAITLEGNTTYAHASGELVLKLSEESLSFGTAKSLERRLVAVVAPTPIEKPSLGGIVNGYTAWVLRTATLEGGQRAINLQSGPDWSLPVSFRGYPDLDVADPDTDTMVVFRLGATSASS